jgi:hypothetical protein
MSAMLAAIAEFRPRVQRQLWAVVDGPSGRVMPVCCAASDGREEPMSSDAANGMNGYDIQFVDLVEREEKPDRETRSLC